MIIFYFHKSQFENMIDCSTDSRKINLPCRWIEKTVGAAENKWALCIYTLCEQLIRGADFRYFDLIKLSTLWENKSNYYG